MAWYLPVDHANEIQTDSVQFDLEFYTGQARHSARWETLNKRPEILDVAPSPLHQFDDPERR